LPDQSVIRDPAIPSAIVARTIAKPLYNQLKESAGNRLNGLLPQDDQAFRDLLTVLIKRENRYTLEEIFASWQGRSRV
jgi:hypothetical protein